MSLWLCLRFHQLPLQCLSRSEELAVAVLVKQRVFRANDCAASVGIREGMSAATVRALLADEPAQLLERDTGAEGQCLQQLCCWAYSITPSLHTYRDDCLQLEVGSCLALFRGLPRLLAAVHHGIHSRGFRAEMGLAETTGAAWLLSFSGADQASTYQQALPQRLAPLPLSLLTDYKSTVDSLRRAGLHTFGKLFALPPTALARRCGAEFARFLQQVQGLCEERHADYQPPPSFRDQYWFGYEVRANDELLPAMQLLLQSLCQFLRNTQLQTTEINWQLIGIDHSLLEICVRSTTGQSNWQEWYQLTRIRLEQLQLATGIEGINLCCQQLDSGRVENIDLFNPRTQQEPLSALLDRLRNRLGLQAVQHIGSRNEHLPEMALHLCQEHAADAPGQIPAQQRPFWLLPCPQALAERQGRLHWQGSLELVYGPERIEDNWWQQPVSRDYYIARGERGQHYWVFRDRLQAGWYVHGIFA
ncbi:DNA polymerase Y family protein [Pseudohalioglobus sediminis]|uniref:DNA polymerase Y family protein n=1 Tax=Pseudohalioglobus sediminis TaxID=2606449 RepID=A0A5B0WSD3_9GAMM|nr:DNA polymerase Y family protein [Pseudohalioglobus sediminis]KAA1189982.1 DNA polymerase Y family protein [Pseudohalioglobus sediminis]